MILDLITRAVAEEEAVAEAQPSWFENAFGDFAEFPVGGWILVAVLLVGGLVVYRQFKSESKNGVEHQDAGSGRGLHGAEQCAEHDQAL